jgi:hypothetical protein
VRSGEGTSARTQRWRTAREFDSVTATLTAAAQGAGGSGAAGGGAAPLARTLPLGGGAPPRPALVRRPLPAPRTSYLRRFHALYQRQLQQRGGGGGGDGGAGAAAHHAFFTSRLRAGLAGLGVPVRDGAGGGGSAADGGGGAGGNDDGDAAADDVRGNGEALLDDVEALLASGLVQAAVVEPWLTYAVAAAAVGAAAVVGATATPCRPRRRTPSTSRRRRRTVCAA